MQDIKRYTSEKLLALRRFTLPKRVYHSGPRRAKELYEDAASRIGILNRKPTLESALMPGVSLSMLGEWGKGRNFFIESDTKEQVVAMLKELAPEAPDLLVAEADRICAHVFDLLGSGPTPLGDKIDWHVDFKTGHRWNPKTLYKRIRYAPYPGGYDIIVPWELSRCQHLIRLGQAYWVTCDERYAREYVAQVQDWIESNPWPFGVNWACTMDVAIRIVNWLWGYYFFKGSPSLTDEFLLTFYKSLLVHGCHIRRNLENQWLVNNNHYLADLVGLIYLGILCPEFKEAAEWREFGMRELWQEMFNQVYADGVNFEASTAYHRLTTELLLSPILLCRLNSISVPDEVMARFEKMLEFVMYYTKPDGTVPIIGDCDNGRLHRLNVWTNPEREWIDHRYLLAIGAVLFQRDDFAQAAGDQWQEALWLLGEQAISFKEAYDRKKLSPQNLGSKAFSSGGIYLMRNDDLYMIVDAGANGQNGIGGHAHNDVHSFEMCSHGSTFIVDPGSYVYTENWQARNEFRSTAFHNTITVDGAEINPIQEEILFQLKQTATLKVNSWITTNEYDLLDCEHDGYCRLASAVTHRRVYYFSKFDRVWLIRDRLIGRSEYQIDLYFHFMPGQISILNDHVSLYCSTHQGAHLALVFLEASTLTFQENTISWLARSYGTRESAPVAHFRGVNSPETDIMYALFPISKDDGINLSGLKERGLTIWNNLQSLGCIENGIGVK